MSLKLGDAPRANSTPAPEGNQLAICYAVIDCGTHTENSQYGMKTNRKIQVSWELPESLHVFKQERGEEPFSVHKKYNFTVGEKSTLRKDLEGWRGKKFTAEDLDGFEIERLLTKACLVSVVHKHTDKGTFANVDAITALPKAMQGNVPQMKNDPVYYDITMGPDCEAFRKLPEFLQKYIRECEEWKEGSKSGSSESSFGQGLDDDDIPF